MGLIFIFLPLPDFDFSLDCEQNELILFIGHCQQSYSQNLDPYYRKRF